MNKFTNEYKLSPDKNLNSTKKVAFEDRPQSDPSTNEYQTSCSPDMNKYK